MRSLFLSLNIFLQFCSLSLSLSPLFAPPSLPYRSPWRWKMEGGVMFYFMKMQTKHSWSLPTFSFSLSLYHYISLYFLISSFLCLHNFQLPRHCHIIKSPSIQPCSAASVSSSHFQICEIKIDAVCSLMKSTQGQLWVILCLPRVMTQCPLHPSCAHTNMYKQIHFFVQ